ncbi:iron uptake system protein EfeO [Galactobacter valiniphilus]|uniref:iron uptake system protein EfeO n=1 Tax=Galactobacter valiniphilus TaxID=2676122 RepID=UPI0037354F35
MKKQHLLAPLGVLSVAALLLTGCTDNTKTASADGAITVTESDTECSVGTATAPAGQLTFKITNNGQKTNEFEVLAADGLRILGELENIGTGTTRELTVRVDEPGEYLVACVPGQVGAGMRQAFTVTEATTKETVTADRAALQTTAVEQYTAYVRSQVQQLLPATEEFAKAFAEGDVEKAKALYPTARAYYERVEPVAESFGNLDPELDFRKADLAEGQDFTGWHRAEEDLWGSEGYTQLDAAGRQKVADFLVKKTKELYDSVRSDDFKLTIEAIGQGAVGLMDEVAGGKISGEEELYSHTDLWDFQANVEGARVAFQTLEPLLKDSGDVQLSTTLTERFAAIQKLLDAQKSGDGFKLYTELRKDEIKGLADSVNALAEPLSQLTKAAAKVK